MIIIDTVIGEYCPKCRTIQAVTIPNLQGLIAAVAVSRVGSAFKLNGKEIRFLRKALEWTQPELAEMLELRTETISRWETDVEPIGAQSEKLLRLHVGERRASSAPLVHFDRRAILEMNIKACSRRPPIMRFKAVTQKDQRWTEVQEAA